MGFFSKLANWFKGKGFKELDEIKKPEEPIISPEIITPSLEQEFEQAENIIPETKPDTRQETLIPTEKTSPIIVPKDEPSKSDLEIAEAQKRIQSKPTVQEFSQNINSEGKIRLKIEPSNDVASHRNTYETLFGQKLLQGDKQIIDILLKNREQFKERFSIIATVYDVEKGDVGSIMINGAMLENTGIISDYVREGDDIDYLKDVFKAIASHFKSIGSIGSSMDVRADKVKVASVNLEVDFA